MKKIIVLALLLITMKSYSQVSIESMALSATAVETGEIITVTLGLRNNHFSDAYDPAAYPVVVTVGLPTSSDVVHLNEPLLGGAHAAFFGAVTEYDVHNFSFELTSPIPSVIDGGNVIFVEFQLLAVNPNPPGSNPQFLLQLQFPGGDMPGGAGLSTSEMSPVLTISGVPLSVSLGEFKAYASGNGFVHLNWNTFKEESNAGFYIERSGDSREWTSIGFVRTLATDGNSQSELKYDFTDQAPLKKNNFYRLKQVDVNNNVKYSDVRLVVMDSDYTDIQLYPNPAKDYFFISGANANDRIVIYNNIGQIVLESVVKSETERIDISNYVPGVYIIELSNQHDKKSMNIIKN